MTTRPTRSHLISHLVGATAGIALAFSTLAGTANAAAPTGAPVPIIPVDRIIDRGCLRPTFFTPSRCKADFTAHVDTTLAFRTTYQGQPATTFTVAISNIGKSGRGPLYTTIETDQYDILGVEYALGNAAFTAASLEAGDFGDRIWIIEHTDGLAANDLTLLRVWVVGHDATDVAVTTNRHIGIDQFGTPGPANYRLAERTRANNISVGSTL